VIPWGQVLGPLAKLLGPLLAKLGIYIAGHRAGTLKAANRSMTKAAKLRKKADEIDDEVANISDTDLRERVFRGADPD
jgi:hypothetical protein